MSRPVLFVFVIVGVFIVVGLCLFTFAWLNHAEGFPQVQAPASEEAESPLPIRTDAKRSRVLTATNRQLPKTDRADNLFDQNNWIEARSAYDRVIASSKTAYTAVVRHTVERAIVCSLKLQDWDDALCRAIAFKARNKNADKNYGYWPTDRSDLVAWEAHLAHLDVARRLFHEIAEQSGTDGLKQFRDRLTKARIAVNFELLSMLDPESTPQHVPSSDDLETA